MKENEHDPSRTIEPGDPRVPVVPSMRPVPPEILNGHKVVLATKHKEGIVPKAFRKLGGNVSLDRRDPEQPHWRMAHQTELEDADPIQVVMEKVRRVLEGLKNENFVFHNTSIIASDVGFRLNGERWHQILRSPEDKQRFSDEPWELDRLRVQLVDIYSQPFVARWHVIFAIQDSDGNVFSAEITIRCMHDGISDKKKIYNNFLPQANSRLKLVEILRDEGATFEILDENEEKLGDLSGEMAYQLIVDKIIEEDLYWYLIFGNSPQERQLLGPYYVDLVNQLAQDSSS